MRRNEKFWVDQVTVPHPPPPPGNDKGWGTTRGGEGYYSKTFICSHRSQPQVQPEIYPLMEHAPQIDHDGLRTFPTKHVA